MTVLAVMFTALAGFGQAPDVCKTLYSPDVDLEHGPLPTNFAVVGVASNFWGLDGSDTAPIATSPALTMVNDYLSIKTLTATTVCHNATATLKANASNYDSLFLADDTAYTVGSFPFSYARGIPVIFGYQTDTPDVNNLIASKAVISGTQHTIANANLASYGISSNTEYLALANPTLAPYGAAAEDIITAMGISYPPPTAYPTLFSNIALTFSAVGTNPGLGYVKAGFVSKAQICSITNEVTYVEFINPVFTLDQTASVVNTSNTVAVDLYFYIQAQISSEDWPTFLTNFCYQAP